jgi:hypothetical protein
VVAGTALVLCVCARGASRVSSSCICKHPASHHVVCQDATYDNTTCRQSQRRGITLSQCGCERQQGMVTWSIQPFHQQQPSATPSPTQSSTAYAACCEKTATIPGAMATSYALLLQQLSPLDTWTPPHTSTKTPSPAADCCCPLTLSSLKPEPTHAVKHELHALALVGPQPTRQHGVNYNWLLHTPICCCCCCCCCCHCCIHAATSICCCCCIAWFPQHQGSNARRQGFWWGFCLLCWLQGQKLVLLLQACWQCWVHKGLR